MRSIPGIDDATAERIQAAADLMEGRPSKYSTAELGPAGRIVEDVLRWRQRRRRARKEA